MVLASGSHAIVPCPKCRFGQTNVALNSSDAVYYRCPACFHVWSVPKAQKETGKA